MVPPTGNGCAVRLSPRHPRSTSAGTHGGTLALITIPFFSFFPALAPFLPPPPPPTVLPSASVRLGTFFQGSDTNLVARTLLPGSSSESPLAPRLRVSSHPGAPFPFSPSPCQSESTFPPRPAAADFSSACPLLTSFTLAGYGYPGEERAGTADSDAPTARPPTVTTTTPAGAGSSSREARGPNRQPGARPAPGRSGSRQHRSANSAMVRFKKSRKHVSARRSRPRPVASRPGRSRRNPVLGQS